MGSRAATGTWWGIRRAASPPPPGEETRSRALGGGRRIRREDSGWAGTMGCFLVDAAHVGVAYGLTNFHVLSAPDVPALAAGTSAVGQPTGTSSATGCCNDLFGKYAGGEETDSGEDEAAIKLDPGTQWQAEIVDIGIVTGSHAITLAEATPQNYQVRKRGSRRVATGGVGCAPNTQGGDS